MSPLLVPGVILAALSVDDARSAVSERRRGRGLPVAAGIVMIGLILVQAVGGIGFAIEQGNEGYGYARPSWWTSDVIAGVDDLDDGSVIVTNDPYAIWALTDHDEVVESPRSGAYRSPISVPMPPDFAERIPCGDVYFVWIERTAAFHHGPDRIAELVRLDGERVFSDGTIWRMQPGAQC